MQPTESSTAHHSTWPQGGDTSKIAKVLLECGANVNAQDTQGVTPSRRALNCRKAAVADLLNAWRGT